MNHCGQCRHAKPGAELGQRICMFAPPQALAIVGPQGIQVLYTRPVVTTQEEACGAGFSPGSYGSVLEPVSGPVNEGPETPTA